MSFFNKMFSSSDENQSDSKIGWRTLVDLGQLNEIIDESANRLVIVFKHSTRCGVSKMVLKQFESEYNLQDSITPYFLDLLKHRDISDAIAIRYDVVHQSPQLLLIRNGKCVYNASHSDIVVDDVTRYI